MVRIGGTPDSFVLTVSGTDAISVDHVCEHSAHCTVRTEALFTNSVAFSWPHLGQRSGNTGSCDGFPRGIQHLVIAAAWPDRSQALDCWVETGILARMAENGKCR
jgi:hypothetical protein